MNPQYAYQYNAAPVVASMPSAVTFNSRPTTTRSTTTEFRGSTNPDEDWTKISDLAERRRIQNRIAQRNYRKKLKRRLEDLERRAASSRSLSPNGDDTDGRSTRESSADGPIMSPPTSSEPLLPLPHEHHHPAYTTASSPYSSHYRTAGAVSNHFSSAASPESHYYTTAALPSISDHYNTPASSASSTSPHYIYAYSSPPTLSSVLETTCNSPLPSAPAGGSPPHHQHHHQHHHQQQSAPPAHHPYLPLPSARLSGTSTSSAGSSPSSYSSVSTPPDTAYPPIHTASSQAGGAAPFYMNAYAGLAETPDPSYFSSYYHEEGAGAPAIKSEH